MADVLDIDLSGFKTLSVSLGRASKALVLAERAVVEKALANIKTDTRKGISRDPRWRRLPATVNYSIRGLSGIVGYDDVGAGELAGIHEFGSSRHAPHPALMPAARDEAPRFEKASLEVAAKIIGAAL